MNFNKFDIILIKLNSGDGNESNYFVVYIFSVFIILYVLLYKKTVADYSFKYKKLLESNEEYEAENSGLKDKISELLNKALKQENTFTELKLKIHHLSMIMLF